MNVLLIGSGGREHAIAHAINKSGSLTKLFCIPGNPGTKQIAENISIPVNSHSGIISFCKENKIELVVIGPEQPLVDGLADDLRKEGIKAFGPDKSAAEIEAFKSFSKNLMKRYKIPTAGYEEFSSSQIDEAKKYILSKNNFPIVIKADGLAAGKGVLICNNIDEVEKSLHEIFIDKAFGSAGNKIVVEDFLEGEEASIFAVTDGEDFICLPASQDHKRIGDNDTGKNTGGMGAYSPAPLISPFLQKRIEDKIIKPVLQAMEKEGRKFTGCLYCGLMIYNDEPKVVEFNCRFGDPETQAVLPLLEGDFLKLLYSAASGRIDKEAVKYNGGAAVCIVAASGGYPDSFEKGFEIKGLETAGDDVIIFQAGTKEADDKVITSGGRVLGITAVTKENNLKEAKEKAYIALEKISFEKIYFRKDIADKAFSNNY